ncbi:MAG: SsrA-binding protein SmpB [Pseudomonadota bacterium]
MKKETIKKYVVNKKVKFDFEVLDRFEAGICLTGPEVKAIREGRASLADAFVREKKGELYVMGLDITKYSTIGYAAHDPLRDKKILMHKREIRKLITKIAEKGLSLIATSVYPKGKYIKIELALVRGKKTHDKREELKRRAEKRDMDRAFKKK